MDCGSSPQSEQLDHSRIAMIENASIQSVSRFDAESVFITTENGRDDHKSK
jgi:hypothetical protein